MPLITYFSNLSPQKLDTAVSWHISFKEKYQKNGCEYEWLVFSSRFDDTFRSLKEKGLQVEIVPTYSTKGLRLVVFLLRHIREKNVTVMHLHFIKPWNAIALILGSHILQKKVTFIYHKRSPGKLMNRPWNPKKFINPLSMLSLFVDLIICNSDSIVENCVNRGVSRKKVMRIYNGVSIERYANVDDETHIFKEFNIPADFRMVAIIKDARPEVGLTDLLYSLPPVLKLFPKTVFLIAGGGMETERLKNLARTLQIDKKVIFAGIRNDVPRIIKASYFTIDPSPVEAFGNVVIESMAGKRPVIGVNAWGPKEIITSGETGLLVEPGHPTDFAPAIMRLLDAPPELVTAMGEKGLERVKKLFTVDRMVENTVNVTIRYLDQGQFGEHC